MLAYSLGPADVMRNGKVLYEDGFWPVDGDRKKAVVADLSNEGEATFDEFTVHVGR